MKKTLAIILSLLLVVCMMPAMGYAETADLSADDVTLSWTSALYTGSALTPTVSVGGSEVTSGADKGYTLTYTNASGTTVEASSITDPGTYYVTVTASSGNETHSEGSSVKKSFSINQINLSSATISEISTADFTNSDSVIANPNNYFTVSYAGETISSSLYSITVTVSGTTYTAKVTPADDYTAGVTGNRSITGYIRTSIESATITVSDQTYNGSELTPTVTVKVGSTTLTKNTHYTVEYANNLTGGSTASVVVTGIGKYCGTASTTFYINPKSIAASTVSITVSNAISGDNPTVVVKDTALGTTLVEGTDYSVSFVATSSTSGTATITGLGNYGSSTTKTYSIVSSDKDISGATVYVGGVSSSAYLTASSYSCYYTGSAQTPTIAVVLNGSVLSSSYYTVTYEDNTDVGTATITIMGKNGYGGTITKTFTINQTTISSSNTVISGYEDSYTYTGLPITPSVTVKVDGVTLTQDTDYTVTYSYNTSISTTLLKGTIKITGKGGYTGSVTATFSIVGKDLSTGGSASFTSGSSSTAYTGSTITPSVTVKYGTTTLTKGTDYTISYLDADGNTVTSIKSAGTYTVVITGKNNYSGELTLTYTVTGIDISGYTVKLSSSTTSYSATSKTPTISSVKSGSSTVTSSNYTVTYENPDGEIVTSITGAGTYKVIVTGKNGYTGSTYAEYTVIGEDQTVTLSKTAYKVYTTSDDFQLSATATGDGTGFSYSSSDESVATVSSTGVVTVHKIGRAVITVTTTGCSASNPASAVAYIKVYPQKTTLTKKPWNVGNSSVRVRWAKQDNVTKYQIRYSTSSSFDNYQTKTVSDLGLSYSTQSTLLTGLKSGTTYYIKVRAIKEVYNESGTKITYYGTWSNWRSVKVK